MDTMCQRGVEQAPPRMDTMCQKGVEQAPPCMDTVCQKGVEQELKWVSPLTQTKVKPYVMIVARVHVRQVAENYVVISVLQSVCGRAWPNIELGEAKMTP